MGGHELAAPPLLSDTASWISKWGGTPLSFASLRGRRGAAPGTLRVGAAHTGRREVEPTGSQALGSWLCVTLHAADAPLVTRFRGRETAAPRGANVRPPLLRRGRLGFVSPAHGIVQADKSPASPFCHRLRLSVWSHNRVGDRLPHTTFLSSGPLPGPRDPRTCGAKPPCCPTQDRLGSGNTWVACGPGPNSVLLLWRRLGFVVGCHDPQACGSLADIVGLSSFLLQPRVITRVQLPGLYLETGFLS